jgi:hypothetical protein
VPSDGHTFDWGIDYAECTLLAFFRTHGAGGFVRALCPFDFALNRATGLRLTRTRTLAEGPPHCDFRLGGREPRARAGPASRPAVSARDFPSRAAVCA